MYLTDVWTVQSLAHIGVNLMAAENYRDPDIEWLDHVQPVGLVIATSVLKELGLVPLRQGRSDSEAVADLLNTEIKGPALIDPWKFVERILGWEALYVAGAPGSSKIPDNLIVRLPEHSTTLSPTWALKELGATGQSWQLLVHIEESGLDPDTRAEFGGWEATPHQRFERLLRDTGVFSGVMITDNVIRLVHAPSGETSGHISFPIRPLAGVSGRPMLSGLKLLLENFRLFADNEERRLPALLKKSRDAQASVSTELAGQVLGALHELLRGLHTADPVLTKNLSRSHPEHLYEGLLAVLMRLVFILYAEDRDLLPSRSDARARAIYETSYSLRGLFARLTKDTTLNPDTMDERHGAWGQILAIFRLVYAGHTTHFVQARGGKLFDPDEFPFLEGRATADDNPRILDISDGCILRILEGLMTLKARGRNRERLSYRTLDVEQIGSVYETVIGFTVEQAQYRVLAIKAGKNNKTPVFVELDDLLSKSGKNRIKAIKENTGRTLSAAQARPVKVAATIEELALALDTIIDERGSPGHIMAPKDTPILQPTNERRRTGSHYTPRSLTGSIITHVLIPVFDKLGPDAKPEEVLDLKVCDPAMGSGAFLVEACRAIASRLVTAWGRWPESRPKIPTDEDENLHARRLVALRCLYGVDRNPRAVDLARLSLWLATLAREHEFTFLDHVLKCGDSLVGLTQEQIESLNWDTSKSGLPLLQPLVARGVVEAKRGRKEIKSVPDGTKRVVQEKIHESVEKNLYYARLIGDAVVATFFSANNARAREVERNKIENWISTDPICWDLIENKVNDFQKEKPPIPPFHWSIEFPEVFNRKNGGFDVIVGNPPFAGKNTITASNQENYLPWLQAIHENTHGGADLTAHFFRRSFNILRIGGCFGLIATNTISQGDTRESGLREILNSRERQSGTIFRATRRLPWPGDAAVIVSVVHVIKGNCDNPVLDGRPVSRISAYLMEGNFDETPTRLVENFGKSFQGMIILGKGFTFDDQAYHAGDAEPISKMHQLINKDPRNSERIFPYLGGEDLNTSPTHSHRRWCIDFDDFPLKRDSSLESWFHDEGTETCEARRKSWLRSGIVPHDYPNPVAHDWPDLIEIIERLVMPIRSNQKIKSRRIKWWQFAGRAPELRSAIKNSEQCILAARFTQHPSFVILSPNHIFSDKIVVIIGEYLSMFGVLASRVSEVWIRIFTSTLKDDLIYVPTDCFENFPFPQLDDTALNAASIGYHNYRSTIMKKNNQGMTKIYNRFHNPSDRADDIQHLRTLHHEIDTAVLRSYGWDDLANQAAPDFLTERTEQDHRYHGRFFWPESFRDEVLNRLLNLNRQRAAGKESNGFATSVSVLNDGEIA